MTRCNSELLQKEQIRNLAIIAHVDHGKTTLVDGLLKSSGFDYQEDRVMDSGALEIEKGITINSKVTYIDYKGHSINLVDTPGHQDFGGEVERVLSMVDGVLMLVCANEGVKRQTKYVLGKAVELGIKPIVVINKVDRESSRVDEVEDEVLELFFDMGLEESLMDYKTFYTSAKLMAAFDDLKKVGEFTRQNKSKAVEDCVVDPAGPDGLSKILDYVVSNVTRPKLIDDECVKPKLLVSQIEHDIIYGKLIRGKLSAGQILPSDKLSSFDRDGVKMETGKVLKLFKNNGKQRVEIDRAVAGDIVTIAGMGKTRITNTVSAENVKYTIDCPDIDKPLVCIEVFANSSPLSGKTFNGKFAFIEIKNRIIEETERDLALEMKTVDSEKLLLIGRGELHLGVLLENMRREGFEMMVSCPKVAMKMQGKHKMEPIENVTVECDLKNVAAVMDHLMSRKGEIFDQVETGEGDRQRIEAEVPARGLLGLKMDLANQTNGEIAVQNSFKHWERHKGVIKRKRKEMIVASHDGTATPYSIYNLEKFGSFMVRPGHQIYAGQVVGISHAGEENVNICKEKRLTNIRAAGNDEAVKVASSKTFSIDEAISFIGNDEWLEITKDVIRIRKIELNKDVRKGLKKKKQEEYDLII